jgi:hypothetical protein
MIDKNELCKKIRTIYPDIGECGIDVEADYDTAQQRWTVILRKGAKELKTFLEPGDVEYCLMGKQCLSLSIEINQLRDSVDRMPERISYPQEGKRTNAPGVCEKAPEFLEHYRMNDDDLPCDDGRRGSPLAR